HPIRDSTPIPAGGTPLSRLLFDVSESPAGGTINTTACLHVNMKNLLDIDMANSINAEVATQ
ncbi:hypothetical protein, partial [Acidiphilium sp. PM]|uniref:hypothetical protein n=1 Tax=Acidiphilium sp. PM TaxID=1043206 RepID=UPI0019D6F67C